MKQELIRFYLQNEKTIVIIGLVILAMIVGRVQESTPEMR
jgi:hypothetical protein